MMAFGYQLYGWKAKYSGIDVSKAREAKGIARESKRLVAN
jgi:hypothetical protein